MTDSLPELPRPYWPRDYSRQVPPGAFTRYQMLDYARQAVLAERERCARLSERFIIDKNSLNSLHPDVPFEMIGEDAKRLGHITGQYIAAAIRGEPELLQKS